MKMNFNMKPIEYGGRLFVQCHGANVKFKRLCPQKPEFCSEDCRKMVDIISKIPTLAERTEWIEIREEGGLWWHHSSTF